MVWRWQVTPERRRGAPSPTADLAYVRDQCRQLQEVDKLNETLLKVPAARWHPWLRRGPDR